MTIAAASEENNSHPTNPAPMLVTVAPAKRPNNDWNTLPKAMSPIAMNAI